MTPYRQPQTGETLHDCLWNYTVPILKDLAGSLSSAAPTRKAELVDFIKRKLSTASGLRAVWASLDELQQAAVAEAVYSPAGRFDQVVFRAKYERDTHWGESDRWGQRQKTSPLSLLIHNAIVPTDLREPLKAFVPPPRPVEIETSDAPPEKVQQSAYDVKSQRKRLIHVAVTRSDMERAAKQDLKAVLRLIDTSKVQASDKTKQVTAAGARAIAAVLQGGDFYAPLAKRDEWATDPFPIKAFAWPLLLQSAGLVQLAGTRLQLTAAGRKALSAPSHEVIRSTWNRWLKTSLLDEFNRIHTIKGQTGSGKRAMTAPASRRKVIVQALRACPPQRWITFDEFSRFMRAHGDLFVVADDLWRFYIQNSQYGSLGYADFAEWRIVQDRYLLAFLFEYAATLGLIDVAHVPPDGARVNFSDLWGADDLDALSRYDGLVAFRINSLGAWCLGLADAYTPEPFESRPVLKVLPNHDIAITQPIPAGDVLLLQRVAEQKSDFVWKIDQSTLLAAVEQGQSVTEVVDFLEARAGEPLPPNVAVFFKEMSERARKLVDRGAARLIEVEDAALANLIAHSARLRSLCMLAGDRHIVVPQESERAFRRALRELGYVLRG